MSKEKNITIHSNNLSIGYQKKATKQQIASDIYLKISQGKFIGLLGKNGIGKSTLIRTICGIQKPLSGEIYLQNKNITKFTNKELANKLSIVLTERLPESQLTVFELVALGRQPYTNWIDKLTAADVAKIKWAIEQTETSHLIDKRFYELSDGQLQRVLIARALAQDTEIIILDEPTAHLDIHHTYKIFILLKKLVQQTNKTVIISTHQINLALELTDELIVMNEKNVTQGNTENLINTSILESLFPKEIIKFNKTLRQFTINKNF